MDIRLRRAMEVLLCVIGVTDTVSTSPFVIIVVKAEPFIADTHAVRALTIVSETRMHRIRTGLFRNDIDNTADCFTAVENRSAALDDLNALNIACRKLIEVVFPAPRNRISIHEHEYAALHAAHVQLIRHRTHRRPIRAK